MRLDANDYSVHPGVIGRIVQVSADLERVRVLCEGTLVADHPRCWARHQSLTDPCMPDRPRPCEERARLHVERAEVEVERRVLADYDRALGLDLQGPSSSGPSQNGSERLPEPFCPRGRRDGDQDEGPPFADRLPHPGDEGSDASRVRASPRLAERARAESWTHEEFLATCLEREVAARESHGGEGRIRAARFPARKSLEEFDFEHARSLRRDQIAHLGTLDFVAARENVVFLGPRAPATPISRSALRSGPVRPGTGWPLRPRPSGWRALAEAHHAGRLQTELTRLGRYPLLVVDEDGYIPFEPEAANLFFQLVSSRYERASVIVTSNKPFGRWGEVFGDDVVAAAMIA